jgi:hypothetical protein
MRVQRAIKTAATWREAAEGSCQPRLTRQLPAANLSTIVDKAHTHPMKDCF